MRRSSDLHLPGLQCCCNRCCAAGNPHPNLANLPPFLSNAVTGGLLWTLPGIVQAALAQPEVGAALGLAFQEAMANGQVGCYPRLEARAVNIVAIRANAEASEAARMARANQQQANVTSSRAGVGFRVFKP